MLNTKTWLEYEAADRFHVAKMKCGEGGSATFGGVKGRLF